MYDPSWDLKMSDHYKAMSLRSILTKRADDLTMIGAVAASGSAALRFLERLESFKVVKSMDLPQHVIELVLGELIEQLETSTQYFTTSMQIMFCLALLKQGEALTNVKDYGPRFLSEAARVIEGRLNGAAKMVQLGLYEGYLEKE